jgi:hypothetical protein
MRNSNDDKYSDDIEISPASDCPFVPVKSRFSLRNNWVLMFILLNCLSLFIIFFLGTGGRPIETAKYFLSALSGRDSSTVPIKQLTAEELTEIDFDNAKVGIYRTFGPETNFRLMKHSAKSRETMERSYPSLSRMPGNSFIVIKENYYYLSSDRERFYSAYVPGRKQASRPGPQAVDSTTTRERKHVVMKEEMYKDEDGFWRNRNVEVDVTHGSESYVIPAQKESPSKAYQEYMNIKQADADRKRAQQIRKELEKNRPIVDLDSYEKFDPSQASK